MRTFQDRIALVTGASSGIGKALAIELAHRGCHLALVDVDAPGLSQLKAELDSDTRRVSTHVADVSSRTRMAEVASEVENFHRALHFLVNNAGVSLAGRFEQVSLDEFDWIMDVNFWGVVHGCRFLLPLLRAQPEAHIVNLCSAFGLLGFAGKSGYSASKAAVRGFSEALRAELSGSSVGLTVVYPGPVDTALIRRGRTTDEIQRSAEAEFVAKRAVPMARVVRAVLRGVRHNRARVLVGRDYRLIDWLARLSPALADRLTARAARSLPF